MASLSGLAPPPPARVPTLEKTQPSVDMLKVRLLLTLHDRFDMSKRQRMPASLVRETARRQLEQALQVEAPRLPAAERDRFIEEILCEAFGFGPLEELFADASVREIAVLGPYTVIVRRDDGWKPTHVKFRDNEHVDEILQKMRSQGEPVGPSLPDSMLDVQLGNGFRAMAIVPVATLGMPPTAAFVRVSAAVPA